MEHTLQHSPNGAGHEQSEVSVRLIVVSLAFLAVVTFIVCVLVVGIFRYFHSYYGTDEATRSFRSRWFRRSRASKWRPMSNCSSCSAKEDHILSTYAWVDQKAGTVRVPIDRAIDLLAAKGLPIAQLSGRHSGGKETACGSEARK